jgi:transcriptional regulator with XRE-family HTH domain
MKRADLLKSEGYWIAKLQTDLYRELISFMEKTNRNSSQLADYLGCSKSYISQLLNGNFDHKISKLVKLSLAIGKAPILKYKDISEYILENDKTFSSVLSSCTSNSKITMPASYFTVHSSPFSVYA